MSKRRDTKNRLSLIRQCGTCGKTFSTSAASPFIRQIPGDDKKQKTTYFCSEKCFSASYKHIGWFDGKAWQRKEERDRRRDVTEKNKRYYAAHADEMRERRRRYYYANLEQEKADREFYRRKRAANA